MKSEEVTRSAENEFKFLVQQERLILHVTEVLTELLDNEGVTKAELANRLGKTPGFVSQLFGGGRNLTLRTIADIATALAKNTTVQFMTDAEVIESATAVNAETQSDTFKAWMIDTQMPELARFPVGRKCASPRKCAAPRRQSTI